MMSKAHLILGLVETLVYHSTENSSGILKDKELKNNAPVIGDTKGEIGRGARGVSFSRGASSWFEGRGKTAAAHRLAFDKEGIEKEGKLKPYNQLTTAPAKERVQELTRTKNVSTKHLRGIEIQNPQHMYGKGFSDKQKEKMKRQDTKKFQTQQTKEIRQHTDVPIHFVDDPKKMDVKRYMFHKRLDNPNWQPPQKYQDTHPEPKPSLASRLLSKFKR